MTSSRVPFVALLLLLAGFLAPLVLRGRVIFPHGNRIEVGLPESDDGFRSNTKFRDQSAYYVPEINHHLNGDHAGWLSTWNPHVQFGRPSSHLSGFSPAFVISRVLGWFTHDAFVFYTWLAALTVVLTGLFGWLFLRALELHPWAAFAGAASLALGAFSAYWLPFVMFLGGTCWTLASAWLVVRMLEKPTLARGLGLAFCVHALLLCAYPQQIVWHGALLIAFTLARAWKHEARVRRLLVLTASVALGFFCAAPVYADLAIAASRSARADVDTEFFLAALPKIDGPLDVAHFVGQWFDANWLGDPIGEAYPVKFSGVCLMPVLASAFLVACLGARARGNRVWLGFTAICVVLTLSSSAYLFAVEHLGLGLSRFLPLAAAWIPMTVAGAMTIDRIASEGLAHRGLATCVAALAPALGLWSFANGGEPRDPRAVAIGLALFAGFVAFLWTRRVWLVPVLVVGSIVAGGARLVLSRPESSIATTSPLVDALKTMTADGSRFAFVGGGMRELLPANEEALLGLRSIQSYDSLSSLAYQTWIERLSTNGVQVSGRRFRAITDDTHLDDDFVAYGGIGALVSREALHTANFVEAQRVGALHLYRARRPPTLVGRARHRRRLLPGRAARAERDADRAALRAVVSLDRTRPRLLCRRDGRGPRARAANSPRLKFAPEPANFAELS
ncbi:MAG: hypothetical protein K8S98_13200 [Planctomycetes bacterium]|nr:hypothetical protein [Planctomycetota bacterium]